MKRPALSILLDYDAAELHPRKTTLDWIRSLDSQAPKAGIVFVGGSVVVRVGKKCYDGLVKALDAESGPPNLLWALVPSEHNGPARRIRGRAYESHMKHLRASKGRHAKLNALPSELGKRYWKSMTHPDYDRED